MPEKPTLPPALIFRESELPEEDKNPNARAEPIIIEGREEPPLRAEPIQIDGPSESDNSNGLIKRAGNASLGLVLLLGAGVMGSTAYEVIRSMPDILTSLQGKLEQVENFTAPILYTAGATCMITSNLIFFGAAGVLGYVGLKNLYRAIRPGE